MLIVYKADQFASPRTLPIASKHFSILFHPIQSRSIADCCQKNLSSSQGQHFVRYQHPIEVHQAIDMNPGPPGTPSPPGGIPADPLKDELMPRLDGDPPPPDCWTKPMLERLRILGEFHSSVNWSLLDNLWVAYVVRRIRYDFSLFVGSALTDEDCLFEMQHLMAGR